jgi:formate hydrogenlyase subunit 3/multisubunit Na+/H+ antiporter MnhD subunit
MALMQHDYKRLLGYHAVSQVGYMVLGFGIGTAIGFAAGLFHMINHAIYKSGLFLAAGAIERQTGKSDIGDLGGLSKVMPVTFAAAIIFAMSISGVPPFNGFASKWMIYQGIIDFGR